MGVEEKPWSTLIAVGLMGPESEWYFRLTLKGAKEESSIWDKGKDPRQCMCFELEILWTEAIWKQD